MKRKVQEIQGLENLKKQGSLFGDKLPFRLQYAINKTLNRFFNSEDYKATIEILEGHGFGKFKSNEEIAAYLQKPEVIEASNQVIEIEAFKFDTTVEEMEKYSFTDAEFEVLNEIITIAEDDDGIIPPKPPIKKGE